ncbi:MAG: ATP-binding protein [Syntrophotaleaceae bacterium]
MWLRCWSNFNDCRSPKSTIFPGYVRTTAAQPQREGRNGRQRQVCGIEGIKLGKPFIYKCLNAWLMDSATPIIVEGYHVATLVMGQVLTRPIPVKEAIETAEKIGIEDIAGFLHALHEVPVMSYDRLQSVVNLMHTIARTISSLAIQKYLSQKSYQQNLHNTINSVSDAIVSTETDGTVRLINKAAARLFSSGSPSIVNRPIFDLFAYPEDFREYLAGSSDQGPYDSPSTFEVLRPSGESFYVQASFRKTYRFTAEPLGYVIVLRDVTQEKMVEQMKQDLIGMLTHDMGNPILSVQRVLELLLDGHLGTLNKRGNDLVPLALNSTHNLSGMVSNFLDIFLDESAGLNLCEVPGNMDSTLAESLQQVGFAADDKQIAIHFQPGNASRNMLADWGRLQRTCANLLANAIRFSAVGDTIRVQAEQRHNATHGEHLLVTIDDQGKGIDKDKHARVFEKFYTTSPQNSSERRGVGLGLTFCKLAVEAHGGEIWVESPYTDASGAEAKGCRFRFRIPVTNNDSGEREDE